MKARMRGALRVSSREQKSPVMLPRVYLEASVVPNEFEEFV